MNVNDPKKNDAGAVSNRRRPYTTPRLIEYGSVAKLTQGTRTTQQDSPGASSWKMMCL